MRLLRHKHSCERQAVIVFGWEMIQMLRQPALHHALHMLRDAPQKRHVYSALPDTVASSSGLHGVQWHGRRGLHVPMD